MPGPLLYSPLPPPDITLGRSTIRFPSRVSIVDIVEVSLADLLWPLTKLCVALPVIPSCSVIGRAIEVLLGVAARLARYEEAAPNVEGGGLGVSLPPNMADMDGSVTAA